MAEWRTMLLRYPRGSTADSPQADRRPADHDTEGTAEGRWYEITGQASYGALLAGVVGLVPPGGIVYRWIESVAVRVVGRVRPAAAPEPALAGTSA